MSIRSESTSNDESYYSAKSFDKSIANTPYNKNKKQSKVIINKELIRNVKFEAKLIKFKLSNTSTSNYNDNIYLNLNNVKPISTDDLMNRIKPKSISTDDLNYSTNLSNFYNNSNSTSIDCSFNSYNNGSNIQTTTDDDDDDDDHHRNIHNNSNNNHHHQFNDINNSIDFRHNILYQAINASFNSQSTPTQHLSTIHQPTPTTALPYSISNNANSNSQPDTTTSSISNNNNNSSTRKSSFLSTDPNINSNFKFPTRQRTKSSSSYLSRNKLLNPHKPTLSKTKSSNNLNYQANPISSPPMSVNINYESQYPFPRSTDDTISNNTKNTTSIASFGRKNTTIRKSLSTPLLSEQDNDVLHTPPPIPSPSILNNKNKNNDNQNNDNQNNGNQNNGNQNNTNHNQNNHSYNFKMGIERRNKPPKLVLTQSTHKNVDQIVQQQKQKQSQESEEQLHKSISNDNTNKTNNDYLSPYSNSNNNQKLSSTWAPGISSETYFARPSPPNQLLHSVKSKLSNLPKVGLTRMRSETLPSPSPSTPSSFDPIHANSFGAAIYGYGGGFGNGHYGYRNKASPISSSHSNNRRPATSPTYPANSDNQFQSSYSVARLKGMLEQHVAQEKNMWHTIATTHSYSK